MDLRQVECAAKKKSDQIEDMIFFTFSECADSVQFRKGRLPEKVFGFVFSSCQIRTRDGWVQSANATAVQCRPPEIKDVIK